jgi:hypothetical protein
MVLRDTMVDYNNMKLAPRQKEIIETILVADGFYPRMHSADIGRKKPRYSNLVDHTKFEILKNDRKNTMSMPTWEFITYISAMSAFIYFLQYDRRSSHIANERLLVNAANLNSFPDVMPQLSLIWYYFLRGLRIDKSIRNNDRERVYRDFFSMAPNRMMYMVELRQTLAMMSSALKSFNRRCNRAEKDQRTSLRESTKFYMENKESYRSVLRDVRDGLCPKATVPQKTVEKRKRPRRA